MNLNNIVGSFGRVPLPFWRAVLPCAFAVLGMELPHFRTVFGALESHFTLRKPIYLPHPRRLLPCALPLDSGRSAQLFLDHEIEKTSEIIEFRLQKKNSEIGKSTYGST